MLIHAAMLAGSQLLGYEHQINGISLSLLSHVTHEPSEGQIRRIRMAGPNPPLLEHLELPCKPLKSTSPLRKQEDHHATHRTDRRRPPPSEPELVEYLKQGF